MKSNYHIKQHSVMNNKLGNLVSQLLSDVKDTNSLQIVNPPLSENDNNPQTFEFSDNNLSKLTRIQSFWLREICRKLTHKSSIPNEDGLVRITYHEFTSFLDNISEKQISRHINRFVKLGLIERYNSKDLNYPLIYCQNKGRWVKDNSYYYAIPSAENLNKIKYQANKLRVKNRKVVPLFELKCEKSKSVRTINNYKEAKRIIYLIEEKEKRRKINMKNMNYFEVTNPDEKIHDSIKQKVAEELGINPAMMEVIASEVARRWIKEGKEIYNAEQYLKNYVLKRLEFEIKGSKSIDSSNITKKEYERKIPEGYRDRMISSKPFDVNTLVSKNKCAPSETAAEWNARMEKLEQNRLEKIKNVHG